MMQLYSHHSATSYSWPRGILSPTELQAGLLTYGSSYEAAFPIAQWHTGFLLPIYSDEFVQDLHLFPFSSDKRYCI